MGKKETTLRVLGQKKCRGIIKAIYQKSKTCGMFAGTHVGFVMFHVGKISDSGHFTRKQVTLNKINELWQEKEM